MNAQHILATKKPGGVILYRGPSLLDGSPIVVVATFDSSNRKTGPMVQTWIMRADVHPVAAVASGEDASICGDCPHRGKTCYVNVGQAPAAVWRAVGRGVYAETLERHHVRGRAVRIGSYGDPAAVPVEVWQRLLSYSGTGRWTGYTHQWRTAPQLRSIAMASCDSIAEAAEAIANGWRPFVVLGKGEPAPLEFRSVACPAAADNPRTTCERCTLCAGASDRTARAPAVTIEVHGSRAGNFRAI